MSAKDANAAPSPARALDGAAAAFVCAARVGRLATSSADGAPHLVPVCFALVDRRIYIGLDSKPKSVGALRLRRVRNILENPKVAFLVDVYDDGDWSRLGFALVSGEATVDVPEGERRGAIAALRAKYPQYKRMLADGATVIRITPTAVSSWGDLSGYERVL